MERFQLRARGLQQGRAAIQQLAQWVGPLLQDGHWLIFEAQKDTRSLKQNRLMWSCLRDLSAQVTWFGKSLTPEGWKEFITGHLDGQELVPNMDGTGFISINRGKRTSHMTIKEMVAVIDLCHAFGSEQGVNWSPTSLGRDECAIDPESGEILQREPA